MKKKQIWTTLKNYSETKQDEFLKDLVSVYESHPKHYGLIYAGFITLSVALSVGLGLVAFYAAFWCCAAHFGVMSYRYTKKVNRFNEKWDF